jgi:23S rRNA-/tRNA-specific pseudouridylate synthase
MSEFEQTLQTLNPPLGPHVRIINSHPAGLIALEKPEGLMSVPNRSEDRKNCMLQAPYDEKLQAYHWKDPDGNRRELYVCHRLDSPTSGVLLTATTPSMAQHLRECFKTREIHKTYEAVVIGVPHTRKGVWKDHLCERSDGTQVRAKVEGKGIPAIAEWELIERDPRGRFSRLRLNPLTGRTHQLRVQSSSRRLPIVGDRTYGDFKANQMIRKEWNIRRLLLHATRLSVQTRTPEGLIIHFEAHAPAPEVFRQLIDNLPRHG